MYNSIKKRTYSARKSMMILILMITASFSVYAGTTYPAIGSNRLNVATVVKVGDMWADQWNRNYKIATKISNDEFVITLYPRDEEAWNYLCKVNVKDFSLPDKKTNKAKQKANHNFVYYCDIEFFYNVEYPSIEECFANYGGFVVNSKDKEAKKRKIKGVVTFNSYFFTAGNKYGDNDDEEMYICLYFDEVGYEIWLYDHLKF